MKCRRYATKAWLVGFALLALGFAGCRAPTQTDSSGRRQWEYCALTLESASAPVRVSITYFQPGGSRVQRMELRPSPSDSVEARPLGFQLGELIARLGTDGWELVGRVDVPPNEPLSFYFKRSTN